MRLSGLFVYPVKGMRGTAMRTALVEPCGLQGDRRWMVVDAQGRFLTQRQLPLLARFDAALSDGDTLADATLTLGLDGDRIEVARGGRRTRVTVWRSLVEAVLVDPAADRWLSAHLGQPCRLVFLDDPRARPTEPVMGQVGGHVSFADGFPLLLTSNRSLAVLNEALEQPIGMDRFRSNLVVDGPPGSPDAWAEHGWSLLDIGGTRLRAVKPCVRCMVPGIDQRSGAVPRPGEPLRTLRRIHPRPDGIVFGHNLVPQGPGRLSVGDRVEILEPASIRPVGGLTGDAGHPSADDTAPGERHARP